MAIYSQTYRKTGYKKNNAIQDSKSICYVGQSSSSDDLTTNTLVIDFPGNQTAVNNKNPNFITSDEIDKNKCLSLDSVEISFYCGSGVKDYRQKIRLALFDQNENLIARSQYKYFEWYGGKNSKPTSSNISQPFFTFSFNNLTLEQAENFKIKFEYSASETNYKESNTNQLNVKFSDSLPVTVTLKYSNFYKIAYLNNADAQNQLWRKWPLTDQMKAPNETIQLRTATPSIYADVTATNNTRVYLYSNVDTTTTSPILERYIKKAEQTSQKFSYWIDRDTKEIYQPGANYSINKNLYLLPVASTETEKATKIGFHLPSYPIQNNKRVEGWYTSTQGKDGTRVGGPGDYYENNEVTNLYAQWQPNTYTITYNKGGNSWTNWPEDQSKTPGVDLTLSSRIPVCGNSATITKTVTLDYGGNGTSNTTGTVKVWSGNWNSFSHWQEDGGDATYGPGASYITDADIQLNTVCWWNENKTQGFTLPTPTYPGYNFKGWFSNSSGGTKVGNGGDTFTSTSYSTIYAQWEQIYTYTISYDTKGGDSISSQPKTHGVPIYLTTTKPNKANGSGNDIVKFYVDDSLYKTETAAYTIYYEFSHWSYNNSIYNSGDSFDVDADCTLTANYNTTYSESQTITLPNPTKEGYTLEGWYTSAGNKIGEGGDSYTPIYSISLYARWAINLVTYIVKYDANGGINAPSSQPKTKGKTLILSSDTPTRSDEDANTSHIVYFSYNGGSGSTSYLQAEDYYSFWFKNWNTASNGTGTSYSAGGNYTEDADVTLFAQWNSQLIGGSVTLPTPNTASFGTFKGWYTDSSGGTKVGNAGDLYTPLENLILFAQWNYYTYTISFDANGGSNAPSSETKTHGVTLTLPTTQPVRSGYTFLGWNTSKNATTATFRPGDSFEKDQNTTLYAIWGEKTEPTYTIHYDLNGGSGTKPESVQRKVGESFILPSFEGIFKQQEKTKTYTITLNPNGGLVQNTKVQIYDTTRYTPFQWNTDPAGKGANAKPGDVRTSVSEGEYTFYVIWSETTYAGQAELPTPTREGYNFIGWKNSNTGEIVSSGYSPAGNDILVAQWGPIQAQLLRYNSQKKLEKVKVYWYESENSPPVQIKKVYYYHNNSWKDVTANDLSITE